ncbi:SWI5/SAE3 family protein [Aspergillus chevalieri]|uniref:Swi5-domain-containing protein n=1 Tax=Aspergillus chevalieri TaxID=182096 RepID=A0A7R7VI24_ASPCH|nr:uncharacterized protein ACHE_20477A [Aspergillus chevalieri]BCR85019.1 hypothetical protein ACHE_20477A [Aspergillus chevalieri]
MPSSPDPSQSQPSQHDSPHLTSSENGQNLCPEQLQREKKVKTLQASINDLQSQTQQLEGEIAEVKAKLKNDPSITVKRHIRLLHDYNEIKDVGQGLMGLIAEARGMRQIEVQREFGIGEKD